MDINDTIKNRIANIVRLMQDAGATEGERVFVAQKAGPNQGRAFVRANGQFVTWV